jgi:hypothetical protein
MYVLQIIETTLVNYDNVIPILNYIEHAVFKLYDEIPLFLYICTVPFAELLMMLGFNKIVRNTTPSA